MGYSKKDWIVDQLDKRDALVKEGPQGLKLLPPSPEDKFSPTLQTELMSATGDWADLELWGINKYLILLESEEGGGYYGL